MSSAHRPLLAAHHQPHRAGHLARLHHLAQLHLPAGLLAAILQARGQDAVDTVTPGANHTWRGAHAELPYALAFASQHLHVPPVDRSVIEAVDRT